MQLISHTFRPGFSNSYRYSFNGMEKDDEIKGDGNCYDFGTRVYDARIGMFLSIDPIWKKFAEKSPYNLSGNNPIWKKDVGGGFEIPIHEIITKDAAKLNNLSESDTKWLSRGAQAADFLGFSEDWHFDNRGSFSEIKKTWENLNTRIGNRGNDFYGLGADLHNVQDFYSHSNYVELYVGLYQAQNNGASPNEVPTYDEGLKNPEFKKVLEKNLKTGKFGVGEYIIKEKIGGKEMPEDYHQQMNKDDLGKGKDYLHILARKAATKHSAKIIKENLKQMAPPLKPEQEITPADKTKVGN